MSAIPGTVGITGPIAPKDSADTYATGDTQYITGAPLQLSNLTALENYNYPDRLRVGQWGYAQDTGKVYILLVIANPPSLPHTWAEFAPGGGSTGNAKIENSNPSSANFYSGLAITNGQTNFSVSTTPISDAYFTAYRNGKLATELEYTRVGANITWIDSANPWVVGEELTCIYNVVPTGAVVTSVFGRGGDVVANAGDYSASVITNDSAVSGTYVDDALNTLNGYVGTITEQISDNITVSSPGQTSFPAALSQIPKARVIGSGLQIFGVIVNGKVFAQYGTDFSLGGTGNKDLTWLNSYVLQTTDTVVIQYNT